MALHPLVAKAKSAMITTFHSIMASLGAYGVTLTYSHDSEQLYEMVQKPEGLMNLLTALALIYIAVLHLALLAGRVAYLMTVSVIVMLFFRNILRHLEKKCREIFGE